MDWTFLFGQPSFAPRTLAVWQACCEVWQVSSGISPDAASPARRGPLRALLKGAARALLWLLVGLFSLGLSLVFHLAQPGVRREVVGAVEEVLASTLRGQVRLGRIETLRFVEIRLQGVAIDEASGRRALYLETLSIRPNWRALARGVIGLHRVEVRGGFLRLDLTPKGELGLLEALSARKPSTSSSKGPDVLLPSLRIHDFQIRSSIPAARGIEVEDLDLHVALTMDPELSIEVQSTRLRFVREEERLGGISRLASRWTQKAGERSFVDLHLDFGGASLRLAGQAFGPLERAERFTLRLDVEGLGAALGRSLALRGVDIEDRIASHWQLAGGHRDWQLEGSLEGERAGRLDIHAQGQDLRALELRFASEGFDPGALLAQMSPLPVRGQVALHAEEQGNAEERKLRLTLSQVRVAGYIVPHLRLEATQQKERIVFQDLDMSHLPGELSLRGHVGFEGDIDLRLRACLPRLEKEPNLERKVHTRAGSLDLDLRIESSPGPEREIDVHADLGLEHFDIPQVHLGKLELHARVQGALGALHADLRLSLDESKLAGRKLQHWGLRVRGGPLTYLVDTELLLEKGQGGQFSWTLGREGEEFHIEGGGTLEAGIGKPWQLQMSGVVFEPGRSITLGEVRLRSDLQEVHLQGYYGFHTPSSLRAVVNNFDLALVAKALHRDKPWKGTLTLSAQFAGTVQRPEVEVQANFGPGSIEGLKIEEWSFAAQLSDRQRNLELRSDLYLDSEAHTELDLEASVPGRKPMLTRLKDAQVRGELRVASTPLEVANAWLPPQSALQGRVDMLLKAEGDLDAPRLEWKLKLQEFRYQGHGPLALESSGAHAEDLLRWRLRLRDAKGDLLRNEGQAEFALAPWLKPGAGARPNFDDIPMRSRLVLPPRRLDEVALVLPEAARLPLRVSLDAEVVHPKGGPSKAFARLYGNWVGHKDQLGCPWEKAPHFTLRYDLHDDESRVVLALSSGSRRILEGDAVARTPVDRWLAGGMSTLPTLRASLRLVDLRTQEIPGLCGEIRGNFRGRFDLVDLMGAKPHLFGGLQARGLGGAGGPTLDADLHLDARSPEARAWLEMRQRGKKHGSASLRLPLVWGGKVVAPRPDLAKPFAAQLWLQDWPVEPLVPLAPGVTYARGKLDATMRAEGSLLQPRMRGDIKFERIALGISEPAQRVQDMSGRVEIKPEAIFIRGLKAYDGEGWLRVDGRIDLRGFRPTAGRLYISADSLPVRQEGNPVAALTARSALRVESSPQLNDLSIRMDKLSVRVPEQLRRGYQSLDAHPEVVVAGREPESPKAAKEAQKPQSASQAKAQGKARTKAAAQKPATLTRIQVDASRPFWVRGDTFAMQLTARLQAVVVEGNPRLTGAVRFRRGFVELLGERFELERGEIQFSGGDKVDPFVDILVSLRLPRRPGDKVFVRIHGPLSEPQLAFSSTVPGVSTAGDALQLIAGGGSSKKGGGNAGSEAASFLAGVTAGILTLTARRELGDAVPMISVDPGNTPNSARLRVGYDADWAIPRFMRSIVTGAYVEGFVNTGNRQRGGSASGAAAGSSVSGRGGFMIELLFPKQFSGRTEVAPPRNWSLDVMWEP